MPFGWRVTQYTKRLQVQFPVRHIPKLQVGSWSRQLPKATNQYFFPIDFFPLSLSLSITTTNPWVRIKRRKGNQEMARGRWERTFSEKSRLERDLRGDGEERSKSSKNGEGNCLFLIAGAFWVGLDVRESNMSVRIMWGPCWAPCMECASDVEKGWIKEWYFEKPGYV